MLSLSTTLYLRILGISNLKVIFIILIITLNLHDPVGLVAMSESIALNVGLIVSACHKNIIIK